ncbi:protein of unknown function (plasmid) [Caballeronia sp. S22]
MTFEAPHGPSPSETLPARRLIEAEVAAFAATERKDADLDSMRERIDDKAAGRMRSTGSFMKRPA